MSRKRVLDLASWERPARPDVGDESPEPIYTAVGRAISRWEQFEARLTFIYGHFTGQNPFAAEAMRPYGDGVGFRGRADILEARASEFFCRHPSQDTEGELADLINNARRAADRRNDIAHGVASAFLVDFDTAVYAWLLTPSRYMHKRFDQHFQPVYAYSADQVLKISECFDDLDFFASRLTARLLQPQKLPRSL